MIRKVFSALSLAALAVLPARADVTAHYVQAGPDGKQFEGGDRFIVEIDDRGNVRAGLGGNVVLIRRGGIDFVVSKDREGKLHATRLTELVALVAAETAGRERPRDMINLEVIGEVVVAGRKGTAWQLTPVRAGGPSAPAMSVVVSSDPDLAPVGDFLRRLFASALPAIAGEFGEGSNVGETLAAVLAKGTPIRIGPGIDLESVDTRAIDPRRFELPVPEMPAKEFRAALKAAAERAGPLVLRAEIVPEKR